MCHHRRVTVGGKATLAQHVAPGRHHACMTHTRRSAVLTQRGNQAKLAPRTARDTPVLSFIFAAPCLEESYKAQPVLSLLPGYNHYAGG